MNLRKTPVRSALRIKYRRVQFRSFQNLLSGCYPCIVTDPAENYYKSTVYDTMPGGHNHLARCDKCKKKLDTQLTAGQQESVKTALILLGVDYATTKKIEIIENKDPEKATRPPLATITKPMEVKSIQKDEKEQKSRARRGVTREKENNGLAQKASTASSRNLRVYSGAKARKEEILPPVQETVDNKSEKCWIQEKEQPPVKEESSYTDEEIEKMLLDAVIDWPTEQEVDEAIKFLEIENSEAVAPEPDPFAEIYKIIERIECENKPLKEEGTGGKHEEKDATSNTNEKRLCEICKNRKPDVFLMPCGHVHLCYLCAVLLENCNRCKANIFFRAPLIP